MSIEFTDHLNCIPIWYSEKKKEKKKGPRHISHSLVMRNKYIIWSGPPVGVEWGCRNQSPSQNLPVTWASPRDGQREG